MARILLIEEDTFKRAMYHRALKRCGHILGGACSGAAALEVIRDSPMFDIIVVENISDMSPLDLMMRASTIMQAKPEKPAPFLSILSSVSITSTAKSSSDQPQLKAVLAEITRILDSLGR